MNKIRIRIKAYDHMLLDKSTEKIVRTAKNTGALVLGPIPLPPRRSVYTVNRSVHVDKKSREQFQIKIHKRIIDLLNSSSKTVDALKQCGKEFAYVNVILDQEVMQDLPKFKDWPTFPQLYIKGELIGGCDITLDLFESGELKKMIDEAKVEKVKTKEAAEPKKEDTT